MQKTVCRNFRVFNSMLKSKKLQSASKSCTKITKKRKLNYSKRKTRNPKSFDYDVTNERWRAEAGESAEANRHLCSHFSCSASSTSSRSRSLATLAAVVVFVTSQFPETVACQRRRRVPPSFLRSAASERAESADWMETTCFCHVMQFLSMMS